MSPKTTFYLCVLAVALVILAVGGWAVKAVQAFVGQTRQPSLRPRPA